MKKLGFFVILFFFIFQYEHVLAEGSCIVNDTPTIYNTKDIHIKTGQDPSQEELLLGVYAIDSCGNSYNNIMPNDGEVNYQQIGEYPLYYYAKETTIRVSVFVENNLPIMTGLKNYTIEINPDNELNFLNEVQAYDYNNTNIRNNILVAENLDYATLDYYIITYTVIDDENNQLERDIYVHVQDTIKPTIENYSDLTIEYGTDKSQYDWWENIVVDDNSKLEVIKSIDLLELETDELGEYTITYYAKDLSSNETTVSINVKVIDTTPPVIYNALDVSFNVGEISSYNYMSNISVEDNYDGVIVNPKVGIADDNVNYNVPGLYIVSFFVSDTNGNFTYHEIKVTILDTTPPIISGVKDLSITLGETDTSLLEGITALDNAEGDLTDQIKVYDGIINYDEVGEYNIFYFVIDSSGNESIEEAIVRIMEDIDPVITGVIDITLEVNDENFDLLGGVAASDSNDGDLTSKIEVDDSQLDLTELGTYTINYSVMDSQGNVVQTTCSVHVVDTTPPVITAIDEITIEVNDEDFDLLSGITASDNYDGDLTSEIEVEYLLLNVDILDTYTITYTVSDSQGNEAQETCLVQVVDSTAPEIIGVDEVTLEVHTDNFDFLSGVTASDNYDEDSTLVITLDKAELDENTIGSYTITYTVIDSEENVGQVTSLVHVVDTTSPEINGHSDKTIQVDDTVNVLEGITATDNYDGFLTDEITVKGNYNISKIGEYTITLEVRDSSDNIKSVTFKLIVNDKDEGSLKKDYSMYYIISIIGISLIGTGFIGYKTRKKRIK